MSEWYWQDDAKKWQRYKADEEKELERCFLSNPLGFYDCWFSQHSLALSYSCLS
jgi:hypothetical protein